MEDKKGINAEQIQKIWKSFNTAFWIIFILKLVSKSDSLIAAYPWIVFSQFVPIIMMVCLIGYSSYKLSGRKLFWLNGLLGLFWFAVIGIFIGYYAVKRIKDYEIKKLTPRVSNENL